MELYQNRRVLKMDCYEISGYDKDMCGIPYEYTNDYNDALKIGERLLREDNVIVYVVIENLKTHMRKVLRI